MTRYAQIGERTFIRYNLRQPITLESSFMRTRTFSLLLCLLILSLNQAAEASPPSQTPSYRIQLRARQFTPSPGIEPAARARIPTTEGETRHFIIQLNEIPTPEAQQALAAQGIRLLNYLPDHAWFASLSATAGTQVRATSNVRWLGEIQTADKLPERLMRAQPLTQAMKDGAVMLRVYYFDDVTERAATEAITRHSGVVEDRAAPFHALVVRLPINQLSGLAAEDAVRWLEEIAPPPTPMLDTLRARMRVNDVQAAPYNLTGGGTVLSMWDCGPVWPHVDFAGRLTNAAGQADNCASSPGHSTHVAGIMAGSGANSAAQGGSPFQWKGVAPGAQFIAYDYFNSVAEVQSAIGAYNIDLAQNSWGIVPNSGDDCTAIYGNYNYFAPEYDQIVTGVFGKRIPVVFAAGNQQQPSGACGNFNTITPPGTGKNVITVGATNSLDDTMTAFSSWGPTDDGRIKPDVVAPGYRNDFPGMSGCSTSFLTGIVSTCPNNAYGMIYGTSMSTPAVSGMLALTLQQYRITTGQPGANPLPSTLKALAIHGAVDLGNPGPDYKFGWGRVDAKNTVALTRKSSFREGSLFNNQITSYTANVFACDTSLKATLVWDDVPATQNAVPTLVNDLDLTLLAPNGTPYYPYLLDPNNPNSPALRGPDHRNNVEQVVVASPMPGAWIIRVQGFAVPQGPQRFSLVSESLNTPVLYSINPSIAQPGSQIVLRGGPFDAGCAPGNVTVNFGGNVSVTVTPGNYTSDVLTVTVPLNAQTGNVMVTTAGGTSNAVTLGIVRPSLYLPLVTKNYPPPFNWIDASNGGAQLRFANDDDYAAVTLPFPFSFFGNSYSTAYVSANGFISFGQGYSPANSNSCIPSTSPPNNAIYAFWTDLDPIVYGAVWSKVVGNSIVIEWQNLPRYGTYPTDELQTFEVILGADNSIIIQYLSVKNTLNAVVGVENGTGTVAIQNYCNGSGLTPFNGQVVAYQVP